MSDDKTWKDKITFMNPQNAAKEIEIGGDKLRFFPVSTGKLFELRAIGQPLASSLMLLMSDTSGDAGIHLSISESGSKEESVLPPTPEIIETRLRHQDKAIKDLTNALTSQENLAIVGGILIDSLRETFPPGADDNPPGQEFINEIPAIYLPAFIKALIDTNKGVLGEAMGNASGLLEALLGKVKAKTDELAKEAPNKKQDEPRESPTETG